MKIVKTFLSLLITLSFAAQSFSQSSLDERQKSFIKLRAAQKTAQMNEYIAYMVDEGYPTSTRKDYMNAAKDLFMGRAEYYDAEGYSKISNMQVTSVSRPTPRTYPVKNYFESLVGLITRGVYDCAKINATDVMDMQVSNLRHLYDNVYECTVAYVQVFCGYKDHKPWYCDRTKKNIKAKVWIIPDGDGGYEIAVFLDDCHATETKKITESQFNDGGLLIPDR